MYLNRQDSNDSYKCSNDWKFHSYKSLMPAMFVRSSDLRLRGISAINQLLLCSMYRPAKLKLLCECVVCVRSVLN